MWPRYLLILIAIKTCGSLEVNPLHLANSVIDPVAVQQSMYDDGASNTEDYSDSTSIPDSTDPSVDMSTSSASVAITTTTSVPSTPTSSAATTTITPTTETTPVPIPSVDVSTTSDSVTATWNMNGSWSDVDAFDITINDVDLNIDYPSVHSGNTNKPCSATVNSDEICDSDALCTFDSKIECPDAVFTPCSNVSVTVSGGGSSQEPVAAVIAPDSPTDLTVVELHGGIVTFEWTKPPTAACETGFKLTINVSGDEHTSSISKTKNSYTYTYDGDLGCGVTQAAIMARGKDGESSYGTSIGFLMTDIKLFKAIRYNESSLLVTWMDRSWITTMNISWSDADGHLISSVEELDGQQDSYMITDVETYSDLTVCMTAMAQCDADGGPGLGYMNCTTSIEPKGPPENIEVSAESSSEIYLYWTRPLDYDPNIFLQYIVTWCNNKTGEDCGSEIKDSGKYGINIRDLEPDTLYDIYVYSCNEIGFAPNYTYIQWSTDSSSVTLHPSLLVTAWVAAVITWFNLHTGGST